MKNYEAHLYLNNIRMNYLTSFCPCGFFPGINIEILNHSLTSLQPVICVFYDINSSEGRHMQKSIHPQGLIRLLLWSAPTWEPAQTERGDWPSSFASHLITHYLVKQRQGRDRDKGRVIEIEIDYVLARGYMSQAERSWAMGICLRVPAVILCITEWYMALIW